MCAPMRAESKTVGVLSIQSYTPNAFTQEHLRTLQVLADYCAGAFDRLLAEEAVRQREEMNRTILATAMDGYYALDFAADPRGAIVDVNEAFCRLTGYSPEELLQMRITDLEAAESPADVVRHSQKIIQARGDRFETRHRRKDGREIHIEICTSHVLGSQGRIFGFVRDIGERKRAEAEINRQSGLISSLLDSIPDIVFFKDVNGVYLGCNNSHYGPVTPRRVRAPGLHPPQDRPLVGRVPSPGVPISSIMRIAAIKTEFRNPKEIRRPKSESQPAAFTGKRLNGLSPRTALSSYLLL